MDRVRCSTVRTFCGSQEPSDRIRAPLRLRLMNIRGRSRQNAAKTVKPDSKPSRFSRSVDLTQSIAQGSSILKKTEPVSDWGRPSSPAPETRPTTIGGWTVREVVRGVATLEGPQGFWKVARGDLVPALGRIESIVLWGNRWIVATSRGLISSE